ncbi:MAG: P4 alpha zinc-binding domain protein [bacterium]|nr:P4 alpha zinc-binding domain protein [bacterium]
MNTAVPLRDICQGRWQAILPAVGVSPNHLTGKHGPCPICGGRDRFRFDDKDGRGTWICSQCGAGDGFKLAMDVNGWDFKEVASRIEPLAGSAPRREPRRKQNEDALREAKNYLWKSGNPVDPSDFVALYLRRRGIVLKAYPSCLRAVEKCKYHEDGEQPRWLPVMVAKVTAPDGKPTTLHRTYLTGDGRKASVPEPRRIMPGKIVKGSAIRLSEPGPVLGVAEGIETALAASLIWSVPTWATVNTSMMVAWEPPPGTEEVIVFADNDAKYGGQSAGFTLAHKLAVRGGAPSVRVEMPPDPGMDWNDALMADMEAA